MDPVIEILDKGRRPAPDDSTGPRRLNALNSVVLDALTGTSRRHGPRRRGLRRHRRSRGPRVLRRSRPRRDRRTRRGRGARVHPARAAGDERRRDLPGARDRRGGRVRARRRLRAGACLPPRGRLGPQPLRAAGGEDRVHSRFRWHTTVADRRRPGGPRSISCSPASPSTRSARGRSGCCRCRLWPRPSWPSTSGRWRPVGRGQPDRDEEHPGGRPTGRPARRARARGRAGRAGDRLGGRPGGHPRVRRAPPACLRGGVSAMPLTDDRARSFEGADELGRLAQVIADTIEPEAARVDQEGHFPWKGLRALADADLGCLLVPRELGGQGAPTRVYGAALARIAAACGSTSTVYMTQLHCAHPIELNGRPRPARAVDPRAVRRRGGGRHRAHRAGGGLRRGLDAHDRPTGRRRLPDQREQDLHLER